MAVIDVDAAAPRRRRPRIGPAALAAASIALMAGSAVTGGIRSPESVDIAEGRIAVTVPADWTPSRVTGGPGSRRLQVSSPADPDLALHITGSYAPGTTLAEAAEVLGRAIAAQPAGVFVGLRADGQVAGRPAVTYREIRPGRVIDWAVVLAGVTRIGVGCQSQPGREGAVRAVCAAAVLSAHESDAAHGTDSRR
ncbi:MAG: type VII secretion-associated protein [Mycobacterium sp.]